MVSIDTFAQHTSADAASLDAMWPTWYAYTARAFVPAFIGRCDFITATPASLLLDWTFENGVLIGNGWGLLDADGALAINDPDDIQRSAHEALAVHQHEEPFFDGLETIIRIVCGTSHTVDVLQAHFVPTDNEVKVRILVRFGGKTLSRTVRTAKDIRNLRALLQKVAA